LGETRAVLLAAAGGKPSDAATVRCDAAADLGAAVAGRVVEAVGSRESFREGAPDGEVSEKSRRGKAVRARPPTPAGQTWWFRGGQRQPGQENRASTAHPLILSGYKKRGRPGKIRKLSSFLRPRTCRPFQLLPGPASKPPRPMGNRRTAGSGPTIPGLGNQPCFTSYACRLAGLSPVFYSPTKSTGAPNPLVLLR